MYDFEHKTEILMHYLESPLARIFRIQDLRAIAAYARSRGIRTVIGNTCATPMYQNPIALGADLCAQSMSEYLCGHSDVVAGCAMGSRADIAALEAAGRAA